MDEIRKIAGSLKWEHYFQVRGHDLDGLIDMMRYDRATPNSQIDAGKMLQLQFNDRLATPGSSLDNVILTMKSFQETKSWRPTVDRWRSMGWPVLSNYAFEPESEALSEFEIAKDWVKTTWDIKAYAEGMAERFCVGNDTIDQFLIEVSRDPILLLACRLQHINLAATLVVWKSWLVELKSDFRDKTKADLAK